MELAAGRDPREALRRLQQAPPPVRRLGQDFDLSESGVRDAMRRACTAVEIPHYHPHDLRHRRATIWHHAGMPARDLAHRGGWSRATVPLEVYTHTMPLTEAPIEALQATLVRTRCGPESR